MNRNRQKWCEFIWYLKFWSVTRHVPAYWSNFKAYVRRRGLPVAGFHGGLNLCPQFGSRFRQKSVEWYDMTFPRKENSSVCHQLGKLWLHYLGISKALTLWASFLVTAVNCVCYTETFRFLNACLYQVCSTIKMSEIHTENPTRCICVSKFIIPYLYEAHHVSGDTPHIIRSLKLHWQPLVLHTWKVVGRVVARPCQAEPDSLTE